MATATPSRYPRVRLELFSRPAAVAAAGGDDEASPRQRKAESEAGGHPFCGPWRRRREGESWWRSLASGRIAIAAGGAAGGGVAAALYSFVFPLFFLLSFSSFLLRECNGTGFLQDGLFWMGRQKEFAPRETLQAHIRCDELQAHTLPSRGEMCSTQHFSHKDKLWTYLLALFEQVVIFVIFSNLTWFDLN